MARPSSLTPDIREQIESDLADGIPVRIATENAQVSKSTLHAWISAGYVERRPRLRLVDDAPQEAAIRGPAEVGEDGDVDGTFERALVGAVLKASAHDWRAAQWLLRNRYPRRWRH